MQKTYVETLQSAAENEGLIAVAQKKRKCWGRWKRNGDSMYDNDHEIQQSMRL